MTIELEIDHSGPLGVSVSSCLSGVIQELNIVMLTVKQRM